MDGGIGEVFVARTNADLCPLFLTTGVVYVGESIAIFERTTADWRYAFRNLYASKARAIRERRRADFL